MKRKVCVFTGFNKNRFNEIGKHAIHKSLREDWISCRYDIWRRYTWKSVLNQTHKSWVYFMCCDPLARDITNKYFKRIKDSRFIISYKDTAIKDMLMVSHGYDEMINLRIDSDDYFHPTIIEELINSLTDNIDWYVWMNGYAYRYGSNSMKKYKPRHTGPFFAHKYRKKERWLKNQCFNEGQHHLIKMKKHKRLSDGKVIVGIHEFNSSTWFSSSCFKEYVSRSNKEKILKEFKIT